MKKSSTLILLAAGVIVLGGFAGCGGNGRKTGSKEQTRQAQEAVSQETTQAPAPTPAPPPRSEAPKAPEKVITTPSGLKYVDLVVGTGTSPRTGQMTKVHYTGWLKDGTKFDSSVDRGEPYSFVIGMGRVIKGWDEGISTMKVGGKRKFIIPPSLGYGSRGFRDVIPPNAELIFEVELLGVQ